MLSTAFTILTVLVGALGTGGVVALAVAAVWLGPAALVAIIGPVLKRFLDCTLCVAVAVGILTTLGAYWIGRHTADRDCAADRRNSEIAAKQADSSAAVKAAADEKRRAAVIEQQAKDQHERDLATIAELQARPAPGCMFDDSDAAPDGLRPSRPAPEKPSAPAGAADKSAPHPASHRWLHLPLVRHHRVQSQGSQGHAAVDGER